MPKGNSYYCWGLDDIGLHHPDDANPCSMSSSRGFPAAAGVIVMIVVGVMVVVVPVDGARGV